MKVDFDLTSAQPSEHESVQFSREVSRNVYFGLSETSRKVGAHDFPGLKLITAGSAVDYGSHKMANELYLLQGNNLIKEDSSGVRSVLGTGAFTERAVFADDGTNLYFVTGGALYKYNGSVLSAVSQSVISLPESIAYINKQFILTGGNGLYAVSDVGDGDTYQSINSAEDETKPDDLIRAYVFNQLLYLMGSDGVTPYQNVGTGNPPFQRRETALINVGIAGKHAVTNTDKYLYWLSDDKKIYQGIGASARPVQSMGISKILDGFTTVSDCIASSFTLSGMDFVLFKFPSHDAALLYNQSNNTWTENDSGTNVNARTEWYANTVMNIYGKMVAVDYRNGNTYELDFDTYTDNSDTRLRIITIRNFTSADIRVPDRQVSASSLNVKCQTGVGLVSGQGVNPVLMCQFSNDGGQTWQAEHFVEIGALGDHMKRVDFWDFATGYEVKARVMISDPVQFSCYGGTIDLLDAGF